MKNRRRPGGTTPCPPQQDCGTTLASKTRARVPQRGDAYDDALVKPPTERKQLRERQKTPPELK